MHFRALGFPGADELGNMWQFKRDFEVAYRARRDLARARALHPRIANFATWLKANKTPHPGGAGRLSSMRREFLHCLLKLALVVACPAGAWRAPKMRAACRSTSAILGCTSRVDK